LRDKAFDGESPVPEAVCLKALEEIAWRRGLLANGGFEIWLRLNSRASECRVRSRCAAYVTVSPGP
jgi:hypothetical protein